jgi:hypothetical protein
MQTDRRVIVKGYQPVPEDEETSSLFGFGNVFGFGSSAGSTAVPETSRDVVLSPRLWDTSNQYETLPPSSSVPKFPIFEGRSRQDRTWLALFTLTVLFLLIQGISAILSADYQLPFEFEQCEKRLRVHSMPSGRSVQPNRKTAVSHFISLAGMLQLADGEDIAGVSRRSMQGISSTAQRDSMLELKDTNEGIVKGPILDDNETFADLPINVTQPPTNLTKVDDGFLKRLAEPLSTFTTANETASDVAMLERLWSVCYQACIRFRAAMMHGASSVAVSLNPLLSSQYCPTATTPSPQCDPPHPSSC